MAICFTGEKWMNMMINDVLFRWAVSITSSDQPSALTCTEGYTSTIRNLCKPVSLPAGLGTRRFQMVKDFRLAAWISIILLVEHFFCLMSSTRRKEELKVQNSCIVQTSPA